MGELEGLLMGSCQIDRILELIRNEVRDAENKFPEWPVNLFEADAIVNEEKGEATKAIIDYVHKSDNLEHIQQEYIQTAAMCVRAIFAIHVFQNRAE